jgi:hypothetical protein
MNRPLEGWTIYPARVLSNITPEQAEAFSREFNLLKATLRAEGAKLYEFVGISDKDSEETSEYDINCVELADLVLAIHFLPSTGVGVEVGWKSAKQEHVISAAQRGLYISKLIHGLKVKNPNYQYVEYDDILDLVPIVIAHFARRQRPGPSAPPLEQFSDSETGQPLFRQKLMPVPT